LNFLLQTIPRSKIPNLTNIVNQFFNYSLFNLPRFPR
jgi:hypothetical protein